MTKPAAVALPAGVATCAVAGAVQDGQRCQSYDTRAKAFVQPDALLGRVQTYERYLDQYFTINGQAVERRTTQAMAPGTPEAVWTDPATLGSYEDLGDSAIWTGTATTAAAMRYAATGSPADKSRLEQYVRAALSQYDATGMDGYISRFHFAGAPAGTPLQNGKAIIPADASAFEIPADKLAGFPDYYTKPGFRPSWYGHVSIDAYSGSMHAFPLAYSLLDDPQLKARMARHYGCFLKRLKVLRITNLSKNTALQGVLAQYIGANAKLLQLDPEDPDITKVDEVWGFYLPQYNVNSAASYPRECPAQLATGPAREQDSVDVTTVGWEGKLLTLFLRQKDGGNETDAIDFAYFTSVRAGDAAMLMAYAMNAYYMTGDPAFLKWRDETLVGKANAREVSRTIGAFKLPKACNSYFRTHNVYTATFVRSLIETDTSFTHYLFEKKLAAKELSGLDDSLFAIQMAAAVGTRGPALDAALSALQSFGGSPDFLADPRRDYDVDNEANPPAGINVAPPSAADAKLCSDGFTLLGVHIPGNPPSPSERFADQALPVMRRPVKNFMWEKDPFWAVRKQGTDGGRQHYQGLDLTEPYWIARAFKLIPDPHIVLAWGPN